MADRQCTKQLLNGKYTLENIHQWLEQKSIIRIIIFPEIVTKFMTADINKKHEDGKLIISLQLLSSGLECYLTQFKLEYWAICTTSRKWNIFRVENFRRLASVARIMLIDLLKSEITRNIKCTQHPVIERHYALIVGVFMRNAKVFCKRCRTSVYLFKLHRNNVKIILNCL